MLVLGNGFLARHVRSIVNAPSGVCVLAAGVSKSVGLQPQDENRERVMIQGVSEKCARSGDLLVYFSSIGPLGPDDGSPRTESETAAPSSRYGVHKMLMEQLVRETSRRYLILRMCNLVGSGQNSAQLVPALARQVEGGRVQMESGALRDLLDVQDAVELVRKLLYRGVENTEINVASGVPIRVDEIVRHLSVLLRCVPSIEYTTGGRGYRADIRRLQTALDDYPALHNAGLSYPFEVLRKYYSRPASAAK